MRYLTMMAAALVTCLNAHAHEALYEHVEVGGKATVVDGNHLLIQDTLIRLADMDAPTNEWCSGCGDKATQQLRNLVREEHIWCDQVTRDWTSIEINGAAYSRCQIRKIGQRVAGQLEFNTKSINWLMVWSGWAYGFHWFDNSASLGSLGKAIVEYGKKARRERRGMWKYDVQIPEDALARTLNPAWTLSGRETLHGKAEVLGGDRLRIGNTTVELAGIAAAEDEWCTSWENRHCGREAESFLKKQMGGKTVTCEPISATPQEAGGKQAFCAVRDTREKGPCENQECWINWELVARGHALARRSWRDMPWPHKHRMASVLAYAERQAMKKSQGMWKGMVDLAAIAREVEDRFAALPDGSNSVTGKAKVLRTTTHIQVGEQEMLLYGVMPPRIGWCRSRSNRMCTVESLDAMLALIEGKTLTCKWQPAIRGRNRMPAGICNLDGEEEPVNRRMLREGHVIPAPMGSILNHSRVMHDWIRVYQEARRNRKGIWRGHVKVPARYRIDEPKG